MQKLEFVLVRKNGNNNETLIDSYVEVLKKLFFNHKPEKLNHELESLISKNFNNELYLVFYEGVPMELLDYIGEMKKIFAGIIGLEY